MKNSNLANAKKAKNDNFYTQLSDIEAELQHYRKHFKGKTVICNCDDPFESNFTLYFLMNFNDLKLKRLISIGYSTSAIMGKTLPLFPELANTNGGGQRKTYYLDISNTEKYLEKGQTDLNSESARNMLSKHRKNLAHALKEDGDFRSDESVELLKQADIVVTNPPFSLFREYVAQIMQHKKKFLIIGNMNAITYKEIFPLIKDNKIWLGNGGGSHGNSMYFIAPENYESKFVKKINGENIMQTTAKWFTNLNHEKRHKPLELMTMEQNIKYSRHKEITENGYLKYDNYDAIEVPFVDAIPDDYEGVMGVPISFLDKYCPEQFEIIGIGTGDSGQAIGVKKNYRGRYDIQMTKDGIQQCPYQRILIRKIQEK